MPNRIILSIVIGVVVLASSLMAKPITYVTKAEFDSAVSNMVDTVVTTAIDRISHTNINHSGTSDWAWQAETATNAINADHATTADSATSATTSSPSGLSTRRISQNKVVLFSSW